MTYRNFLWDWSQKSLKSPKIRAYRPAKFVRDRSRFDWFMCWLFPVCIFIYHQSFIQGDFVRQNKSQLSLFTLFGQYFREISEDERREKRQRNKQVNSILFTKLPPNYNTSCYIKIVIKLFHWRVDSFINKS